MEMGLQQRRDYVAEKKERRGKKGNEKQW